MTVLKLYHLYKRSRVSIGELLLVVLVPIIFHSACRHQPSPAIDTIKPQDISALEEQALRSPENVKVWVALGNQFYDTNQWQKAIGAYQKALDVDPKNVDVRADLGTCYYYTGKHEKAIEELRIAIGLDPNHRNAWFNSGMVLAYGLNKPEEAIAAFEKYLVLAPESPFSEPIKKTIKELKAKESHR